MMGNEIIKDELILNKIYIVRDQKVMVDRDLAEMYGVETKVLNQAVKRNANRFPQDFMFKMTNEELENWKSQFVTSNLNKDKMGLRKLPALFTEQGVAMLSSVLKSDTAVSVNIQIIRVFTRMRKEFTDQFEMRLDVEKIKNRVDNQEKNLEIVFRYLDEFTEERDIEKKEHKRIRFQITQK